jgi:CHAT domain-containing protein
LTEAKSWLRSLRRDEVLTLVSSISSREMRSKGATKRKEAPSGFNAATLTGGEHPYSHPYYWAAFVLVGDPD